MRTGACPGFFDAAPMGRREFLRAGSLGLLGLTLPQLARAQPAAPPRAKACILLFMWGGPAQQDTWDLKPDAPADYRGEFRPIPTNVPGIHICEHLPLLARRTDKLALVRSMTGRDGRDHWGTVFTTVLAGGGVKGGVAYGSSDRYAASPATHPTPPADLAATVYHCLGVDPQTELTDRLGRPLVLCEGTPIRAILS